MLKSKKFWSFEICDKFELTEEIISKFKSKGKFYEDGNYFYEQLGSASHPSIKKTHGTAPTVISFENILVDINTLKILFILLPNSKITSLKFSGNRFTLTNLEFLIDSLLNKPNEINNFSYEWNNKINIDGIEYFLDDIKNAVDEKLIEDFKKTQDLIISLVTKTNKLENLCLRSNLLGDDMAIKIFEGLKDPKSNIKHLNLYKNNLTIECIKTFSEILPVNKALEEINFGRNNLSDECLSLIQENYGLFPMTEEEVEEYNKLAKERQDIIKKNEKLKASKKPELEVPFLEEMKEIDGAFYKFKNNTLKVINIFQNEFTKDSFEGVQKLLDSNPELCMTIDYKIYNEEQRNIFTDSSKGNYYTRVYLLK